jgi:hypothetical protein
MTHVSGSAKHIIAVRPAERHSFTWSQTGNYQKRPVHDAPHPEAMKEPGSRDAGPLGGSGMTVEADETWVGGKAANRAYGPIPPKRAVAALVERGGRLRMFHVPHVTASNLTPLIARHGHPDSRFMTDESKALVYFANTRPK